jgi:hypothetical protein
VSVQYGTHVRTILLITVNGGELRVRPVELPMVGRGDSIALDYPDHPRRLSPTGGSGEGSIIKPSPTAKWTFFWLPF